jgi:DNA polymerase IIIc chi subunit
MKLSDYPPQIAQAARLVNELDSKLLQVRHQMHEEEGQAEAAVAFENDLKNENQRKARRFLLLQTNQKHQDLQQQFMQLTMAKANAMTELERLRNGFTAAKLQARQQMVYQLAILGCCDPELLSF